MKAIAIHTLSLTVLITLSGACKAKPYTSSVASETPAAAPDKKPLSPQDEVTLIRAAYDHATTLVRAEHPGLGRAWTGNMTGLGPKCDMVKDAYEKHVSRYLRDQNVTLQHYIPVAVFDSGWAPGDLSAHIYMGIGTKPKTISEQPKLYSWTDPWRYGNAAQFQPGTGPNSPDQVIPMY